MKKLIHFELYKLVVNKFFVFSTIALLLANLFVCLFSFDTTVNKTFNSAVNSFFQCYNENPDEINQQYSEYLSFTENQLEILDEAIKHGDYTYEITELPNRYAPPEYTDEQFFEILFSVVNFEDSYNTKINTILNEANSRLNDYHHLGIQPTTFSYRLQKIIISKYESLKNSISFPISYTHGWDTYFNYTAINIFIFISLSIAIVIVFTQDNNSGFRILSNTTKNGKFPYIIAKIFSICIICFFTVLIFHLTTLLLLNFTTGFSSPTIPIQMIYVFELCPLSISVSEYLLISFLFKIFVFIVLSLFIITISVFLQNTLLSFLSSLLILGSQIIFHTFTLFNSSNYLKVFDFISATKVNDYFIEYRALNCLDFPVNFLFLSSVVYVILFFFFLIISSFKHISYSSPRHSLSTRNILLSKNRRSFKTGKINTHPHIFSTSCLRAELYKLSISSRVIIFVIALLICKVFLSLNSIPFSDTYDEITYKNYINSISGPLTESSKNFILTERSSIDLILSKQTEMQQSFFHNEITYSEYRDYLSSYRVAYSKNHILSSIEKHLLYIEEQLYNGYDAWFVYDSGWNSLFLNTADWTQYIALLILFSGIFASEYIHTSSSHGFANILRTTRFGRERTFNCKFLAASIISITISILWNLIDLLIISSRFELNFFSAPIHSLEAFSNYNFNYSIGNFVIYFYLLRVIASLLLSSLICSISIILQKILPVITSISLVLILPTILSYWGIIFLEKIDLLNILQATPLLLQNSFAYLYIAFLSLFCFYIYKRAERKWNCC